MSITRRTFLGNAVTTAAAAGTFVLPQLAAPAFASNDDAPQTPFEASGSRSWTSHDDELAFYDDLLAKAPNTFLFDEIGRSDFAGVDRFGNDGRLPLHVFAFGTDETGDVAVAGTRPTVYILGSQHGNEPAGREACIQLIRDLAYTQDPALLELLSSSNVLITPTANPVGRQQNRRENFSTSQGGLDINRDHLNLRTSEARAYAGVSTAWKPYMIVDHHEYGPSTPVVYDDDVLYLWPRNLNVDETLRAKAKEFCVDYIKADCEDAGYTADEYGLQKVGPNVAGMALTPDVPLTPQTAGDWDDGIARNAGGLRNTMGILVESAVSSRWYASDANVVGRRVASQRVVMDATLRFLAEQGDEAMVITAGAAVRRAEAGAAQGPVYFNGQDDPHPGTDPASVVPTSYDDPGAKEYRIPASALDKAEGEHGTLTGVLGLHEVDYRVEGDDAIFDMAQQGKNMIPLLFDSRAERYTVDGTPSY